MTHLNFAMSGAYTDFKVTLYECL